MIENWLTTSWTETWLVVVSATAILLAVIAAIRVVGLRSLSKMSSFDFTVTVAIGSIVAGTASTPSSLPNGALAVAALLGIQALISWRRQQGHLDRVVDNEPLLLMRDGVFIDAAMATSRVSPGDVYAKLRGAGIQSMDDVRAVVLETTGDISVLHGKTLAPELLRHVRGAQEAGFDVESGGQSASRKA